MAFTSSCVLGASSAWRGIRSPGWLHLDRDVLLRGMTVGSPSFRGPFWPAGRIPCGKTRFSAIFVEGWRLVRLADVHAEQAPDPRGDGIGRLARQLFCCGSCLMPTTTTASRTRTSTITAPTTRTRMVSISFWPPWR